MKLCAFAVVVFALCCTCFYSLDVRRQANSESQMPGSRRHSLKRQSAADGARFTSSTLSTAWLISGLPTQELAKAPVLGKCLQPTRGR